jgi:hypothetical protein
LENFDPPLLLKEYVVVVVPVLFLDFENLVVVVGSETRRADREEFDRW